MPPELMGSQFSTFEPLEPDEPGATLDVAADGDTLVAQGIAHLEAASMA